MCFIVFLVRKQTPLVSFVDRVYGESVWRSTGNLMVWQPASRGSWTVDPDQPSSCNSISTMNSSEKGNHDLL